MPSWLTEVLKLLGFTTPFVYAAAVYGIFRYLDKKASGAAKQAVSDWLQSKPSNSDDLGNAVVEMFNRFYTSNLLSFRAFTRSTIFTITISGIFVYELLPRTYEIGWVPELGYAIAISLLANVLSDYVSLFVVKSALSHNRHTPIAALIRGATAGMVVVIGFAVVQNMVITVIDLREMGGDVATNLLYQTYRGILVTFSHPVWLGLFLASLVVHLWLPLFLLAGWTFRCIEYLKLAVGWVQWFIKQGRHHPFEAVGYVAAVIVFITTAILGRALS